MRKFHKWYDRQREPYRFFLFMLICSPVFLSSILANTYPITLAIGMIITCVFTVTRVFYLYGGKK